MELWINAFIPGTVGTYTQVVKAGVHKGKTAVPLPGIARINPLNWGHPWNDGFLTDQRGFSAVQTASMRMQSSATVQVTPTTLTATGNPATTSGTTGVDIVSGKVTGVAGANLRKCTTLVVPGAIGATDILTGRVLAVGSRSVVIEIVGAGSDPLVSASADIDYNGRFQVYEEPGRPGLVAQFSGKIDAFPAFEAYASFNGTAQTLFTIAPPVGNTVVNLLWGANRPVSGKTVFF